MDLLYEEDLNFGVLLLILLIIIVKFVFVYNDLYCLYLVFIWK